MSCWLRKFKKSSSDRKEEETVCTTTLRNGQIFLEKLIASFDGKRNPIRSFSNEDLKIATNNYSMRNITIAEIEGYILYMGFLRDRGPILVMKYRKSVRYASERCFNNIVFASQMNHKSILKLIGCCLETEMPALVYEPADYCTLADRLYGPLQTHLEPLLLTHRLKVAMEIANAVAYLHFGFPQPIVFRNIEPWKILFQEEYEAKMFDFSLSKSIPEGKTHIKASTAIGSLELAAPEDLTTGYYNEKTDVYSFGKLLLVLLTGRTIGDLSRLATGGSNFFITDRVEKFIRSNGYMNIDPVIVGGGSCFRKEEKLQAYVELAFKCLSHSAEDRPTMIDVAKKLRQMYRTSV